MKTPTTQELHDPDRYELLLELDHATIAGQIKKYLFSISLIALAYWGLNLLVFGWILLQWWHAGLSLLEGFPFVSLGMVTAWIALLPVHEHVHAAAYRIVGAHQVRVHYTLRTLSAYCVADGSVVGGRAFAWVCLAPFIILNTALLVVLLALPPGPLRLAFSGGLLLHIGATSGDVAFLNFVWRWRHRQIWTYDDDARAKSFFFSNVA
jgi:hypothetical protein